MHARPTFAARVGALVALLAVGTLWLASPCVAGTTGKLAGRVTDTKTQQPITNATIIIVGAPLGATVDDQGRYVILNIPPGTYSVKVLRVGYNSNVFQNVRISADATTTLDATLEGTAVLVQEIVIRTKRPVVKVNLTSNVSTLDRDDIKALPVQELNDVVNLQAGVVDGHFRGGRADEVQYQVDGVSVNNSYNNSSTVKLDRSLLEEVQIISGTFDAEYGQAMSGVVNAVLRRGSDKFKVGAEAFVGSYAFPGREAARLTDYSVRPQAIQNFQMNISGPTGLPQTVFLASARRYHFDDYVLAERRFVPTDSSNFETKVFVPTGDSTQTPLGYSREWSGLGKITNRSLKNIVLDYQAVWNLSDGRRSTYAYRFNPEGLTTQHTFSIVHGLDLTQTLGAHTFYTLTARQNYFRYHDWAYDDLYDPRYDDAGPASGDPTYAHGAVVQGVDFGRFVQKTNSYLAKGSFVSQVNHENLVKVGGEFELPTVRFGAPGALVYTLRNGQPTLVRHDNEPPVYPGVQQYKPRMAAAFAQDQVEWKDLTLRAGARLDYFNAHATLPSDLANPANAIEGAPESHPVAASAKVSLSPRIGISYPISPSAAFSFAYGHFYQMPGLGGVFTNADYTILRDLQAGGISYGVLGNPDIKPERTVQYQFGYKSALSDAMGLDVSVFYKDIRDLLGVEFVSTYNGAEYARLTNADFGSVLGFTVALDQRQVGLLSTAIDYTWQAARGNASDPRETATRAAAGEDPRPREVPLNWDQRNTLNATVTLARPDAWTLSTIARLGSGQPYTPSISVIFGGGLEANSGRKPTSFTIDMRAERRFRAAGLPMSAFARAFNVTDARYNNGFVFANSGSPYYSRTPTSDQNQLEDPTRFYAPRRIEVGLSLSAD